MKRPLLTSRSRAPGISICNFFLGSRFRDNLPGKISAPKAERHVNIENPAPADRVDQETTKRRAGKEPNVKCRGSETQRLPPFLARQSHRNNRPAVGRNHRPADGLNGSEEDELARRLG